MLTCNYQFKLKPNKQQINQIEHYLDACRKVWNFGLAERKDWINSRKSSIDRCNAEKEYIIPADAPYPSYKLQAASLTEARKNNAVLNSVSNNELIKRPRFFSKLHRKLRLLQRRLKNKQLGSNNRHKLNQKIARIHQTISDTRKNFHYKLAHHLCDDNGMIFVEDIDFKSWSRNMLCKHNLDAGFGQFLQILSYVCWKRDVYFAKVDKNYTSQICPNCGVHTGKKQLRERFHYCPECDFRCNRDFAASLVILSRGLNAVGQIVLQNACGDGPSGFGSNVRLDQNR